MGDLALLNKSGILPKLALPRPGSYLIEKVHNDETGAIAKSMTVTDRARANIR